METSLTTYTVTVPSGTGMGTLEIALGTLARAEARQDEVSSVTKFKAPELARAMDRGHGEAAGLLLLVNQHLKKAEDRLALRKASILLDELPGIMVSKGLGTSNKELREAVFAQDAAIQEIAETIDQLTALRELLKIKAQSLRNTFDLCKKIAAGWEPGVGDADLSHAPGQRAQRLTVSYPSTGTECPVCRMSQHQTPSGVVCPQGHGF